MNLACPHGRALEEAPTYDVDFYDDAFIRAPWPHYAAMRALGPVVWLPRHRNFAVTQYREVREILQDWRTYSSAQGVAADDAGCDFLRGNTLASDPPIHDEMRIAMSKPLLPGALARVRERVDEAAVALVNDLVARRNFDGIADFARFLPLTIVTQLVGLPEDGRGNMLKWAAASFDILGVQNARGREAINAVKEMRHWIATRATPEHLKADSWTARIHELVEAGQIPAEMAPLLVRDYINPSLDTTISATGQLIYQLGKNPDQWQLLRERPELIPNAVNEAVRLGSPIRSFSRTVVHATALSGVPLAAGSRVMVLFGSANRDERKFPNPDKFDVTRSGFDHVGFGHGIHMCVGMHLAQLEMQALLKALIYHVDRIVVGEPTIAINNTIHAFSTLRVSMWPIASPQAPVQPHASQAAVSAPTAWIGVSVDQVTRPTPDIVVIDVIAEHGQQLPSFTAGAHIDVEAVPGIIRQYSLCGDPVNRDRYRIAVRRDASSRGGSNAIHSHAQVGARLRIRPPRNSFPLNEEARCFLLFAAGIGITPILCMAYRLDALGRDFLLHYAVRRRYDAAFISELLRSPFADKVRLHVSDEGSRLDIQRVLSAPKSEQHVYICGPHRFIEPLVNHASQLGWLEEHVHVERFSREVVAAGEPFTIIAERSGKRVEVASDKTILAALKDAGIDVQSSCQSGVCGTCLTDVLQGIPEHRDLVQTPEEKASNLKVAVCCSRARSRILVLDI
ncbi:cytochrome P450/oxidoreductase [Bradyrhizobium uaiense]|uniref:Cytochrome P450 n=1 Tax=Bradyrhizobium uaiense TaxID=2594946 RepID=A0A6P1BM36_9BRAD|nr:cytochrome P450/oxidoreductase [Bradyrhizobium uaiense]NEU98652.1 cytochrome P450 [Bradyrhizobium uaiense]